MVWQKRVFFSTALLVSTWLGASSVAQQAAVEFIAPRGAIVVGSGDTGDVVVITGRSLGAREVDNCAPSGSGGYPVQMGVALDPQEQGRQPRATEIQPVSQSEPFRPGTRLKNLVSVSLCAIGNQAFEKFRGEIE